MFNRRARGLVRAILVAGSAAVLAVIAVGISWLMRPAVTVTRAIEGPVIQAFYATGTVRPRLEYPISSHVGGVVEKVLVRQGSTVAAGQALALVVDPMLQYQADKARADLHTRRDFADAGKSPVLHEFDQRIVAMQQMLDVAQQQEQRFSSLAERNAASANDRDQAIEKERKYWSDLESLKAQRAARARELEQDVEVAESAARAADENLRRQTLRSPVDGVVLDEPIAQGTRVEVNGHVMQIADVRTSNLIMRAAVDEENIAGCDRQQRVKMTLYSFPGRTFDGVVEQRYPKADPSRRTFDVDVRFVSAEPKLQPGMTGELAFIQQVRERALIVPSQAVQNNAVWSIRGGKIVKTDAAIGIRSIERIEVTSGLNPGELVVISPIGGLSDGQAVRIGAEIDAKVAADLNKPGESTMFSGFK